MNSDYEFNSETGTIIKYIGESKSVSIPEYIEGGKETAS